jgi:NAD(P)-dependent dehydrogenase (short-subunit alcohol dehydrogenase family)
MNLKKLQEYHVTTMAGEIFKKNIVQKIMLIVNGKVNVLTNIVSIMDFFLSAVEVDDATWVRVMAVNVTAIMRLTRAVLPLMIKANGVVLASDGG